MSEPPALSRPRVSFHAEPQVAADDALWLDCVGRAAREADPVVVVEALLTYLEGFPLGAHNREVAERIESLLDRVDDDERKDELAARLRRVRDPFLPPLLK
jgi:hypothetical protein